jgi:hypothetical protein
MAGGSAQGSGRRFQGCWEMHFDQPGAGKESANSSAVTGHVTAAAHGETDISPDNAASKHARSTAVARAAACQPEAAHAAQLASQPASQPTRQAKLFGALMRRLEAPNPEPSFASHSSPAP